MDREREKRGDKDGDGDGGWRTKMRRLKLKGGSPPVAGTPPASATSASRDAEDDRTPSPVSLPQTSSTGCIQEYDAHGFLMLITANEKLIRQTCDANARTRLPAWRPYSTGSLQIPATGPPPAMLALIRKGIPQPIRLRIWRALSGADKLQQAASPVYYADLAQRGEADALRASDWEASKQIENDLRRTFPDHAWLNSEKTLCQLRRVLLAYALRNPRVGYCQSMNFVAALLLLIATDEETAFWLLAALIERVLTDGTYARDLSGTRVEQRVLDELVKHKMPKLAAHFKKLGCEMAILSTEWFLCLYARSLPIETTMRVWDALFGEGADVLFRVALALFKLNESVLLRCEHVGDVIEHINEAARHMHDRDLLLKTAFDGIGHISNTVIYRAREQQLERVSLETQERILRRTSSSSNVMHGSLSRSSTMSLSSLQNQQAAITATAVAAATAAANANLNDQMRRPSQSRYLPRGFSDIGTNPAAVAALPPTRAFFPPASSGRYLSRTSSRKDNGLSREEAVEMELATRLRSTNL